MSELFLRLQQVFHVPIAHLSELLSQNVEPFAIGLAFWLLAYLGLWLAIRSTVGSLNKIWRAKFHTSISLEARIKSFSFRLAVPLLALTLVLEFFEFEKATSKSLIGVSFAVRVLCVVLFTDNVMRVINALLEAQTSFGASGRALLKVFLNCFGFSLVFLWVLNKAGVSLAPFLASLGIGSLAVALALQDTLSNFFSGLYLLLDSPIRLGDWIALEDGLVGKVDHVGWRSTKLEVSSGVFLYIPNNKLSSSRVKNFSQNSEGLILQVPIKVSANQDLLNLKQTLILDLKQSWLQVFESLSADLRPPVESLRLQVSDIVEEAAVLTFSFKVKAYSDKGPIKDAFLSSVSRIFTEQKLRFHSNQAGSKS